LRGVKLAISDTHEVIKVVSPRYYTPRMATLPRANVATLQLATNRPPQAVLKSAHAPKIPQRSNLLP
jgi:hypothetical protein